MTKNKIIGIDIDNVLSRSSERIVEFVKNYIPGFSMDKWASWHLSDCADLTEEVQEQIMAKFHKKECLSSLERVEKCAEVINLLRNDYQICLLTNRPLDTQEVTLHWLKSHGIEYDTYFFCQDKSQYTENMMYLIEDAPHHAEKVSQKGVKVILLDKPWNQDTRGENIIRVGDWQEIYNFILQDEMYLDDVWQDIYNDEEVIQEIKDALKDHRDILDIAKELTSGQKQKDYGHPYDDFTRTGRIWGALLDIPDIPPHKVALMLAGVKQSRLCENFKLKDSWCDGAGYFRCGWLCVEKE